MTNTWLPGKCFPRCGVLSVIRWNRQLAYGSALAFLEGFLAALPYVLLYFLLCRLFVFRQNESMVVLLAVGMVIFLFCRIFVGAVAMPQIFGGVYSAMGGFRLRVVEHLQALPLGWFNRARGGDIAARLTTDVELVESLFAHFLGIFANSIVQIFFIVGFLFYIDKCLALTMIFLLIPAAVSMGIAQRLANRAGSRMFDVAGEAKAELLDYIQGIVVIRSFCRFGQAWNRLERALNAHYKAMMRVELEPAPWVAVFGLLVEAGFILVVLLAVHLVLLKTLSAQTFLLFAVLSLPLYRQIHEVGFAVLLLRFGTKSMERLNVLLKEAPLPEPSEPCVPKGYDIVFDSVRFSYTSPHECAVHDVNFSLAEGTLTALVGSSGAGKSTLLHLMTRLWDVQGGAVRIGGIDVRAIGSSNLNAMVATVFQNVDLFAGSVLDNLRIARPEATFEEIVAATRAAFIHDVIECLPQKYETLIGENGHNLSGGERQRLSIARALLKNAPILLLDEATASVDPSSEAQIQDALTQLVQGRTVVVIAHQLRTITQANLVLVMHEGRIVEQGQHHSLLARQGIYARLWQYQERAHLWRIPVQFSTTE